MDGKKTCWRENEPEKDFIIWKHPTFDIRLGIIWVHISLIFLALNTSGQVHILLFRPINKYCTTASSLLVPGMIDACLSLRLASAIPKFICQFRILIGFKTGGEWHT
jgi:hypothetical protein